MVLMTSCELFLFFENETIAHIRNKVLYVEIHLFPALLITLDNYFGA